MLTPLFLALSLQAPLPEADPLAEGLDLDALDRLVERAEAAHSDALVLLFKGKLVLEEHFGKDPGPIESMSVTKSIVSMAVGAAIDEATGDRAEERATLHRGVHTPVSDLFPEWRQGRKRAILVRHLLTHESGLQAGRTTEDIYASPDFVQLALCAELDFDPGRGFFYNNKAVNLLAGVVEQATGEKLDAFLSERLFRPLGITDFGWSKDPAGNPHAMSGLQIRPLDLAKLGELMLRKGRWGDRQLLSEAWVAESTRGQDIYARVGYLWWVDPKEKRFVIDAGILEAWKEGAAPAEFIEAMAPLEGRAMTSAELEEEISSRLEQRETWDENTWQRGLPDVRVVAGPSRMFRAEGYLGQHLVVLPEKELVGVRMIRRASWKGQADNLQEFAQLVDALSP